MCSVILVRARGSARFVVLRFGIRIQLLCTRAWSQQCAPGTWYHIKSYRVLTRVGQIILLYTDRTDHVGNYAPLRVLLVQVATGLIYNTNQFVHVSAMIHDLVPGTAVYQGT